MEIEINENVKKFIEKNIKLIENHDLGAIHVKAESLDIRDRYSLYKILRAVENSYIWLQNTTEVPNDFFGDDKVDTIIIPCNVDTVNGFSIFNCDINKMVCEENADRALRFINGLYDKSHIKLFISKRDLELHNAALLTYIIDEFETNSNIIVKSVSPFRFIYDHNKDIHFTVSKDSMLIYSNGKSPESLAKHLINIGFNNVTVV